MNYNPQDIKCIECNARAIKNNTFIRCDVCGIEEEKEYSNSQIVYYSIIGIGFLLGSFLLTLWIIDILT